jgi:hypothetical protein
MTMTRVVVVLDALDAAEMDASKAVSTCHA